MHGCKLWIVGQDGSDLIQEAGRLGFDHIAVELFDVVRRYGNIDPDFANTDGEARIDITEPRVSEARLEQPEVFEQAVRIDRVFVAPCVFLEVIPQQAREVKIVQL